MKNQNRGFCRTPITGIVVRWNKIEKAVDREDLDAAIKHIEEVQSKASDRNTLEHEIILEKSKEYTDKRYEYINNIRKMRYRTLEKMIKQSSEKQDLILKNLNEWIRLNEMRLRRLEDIEFNKAENNGNK